MMKNDTFYDRFIADYRHTLISITHNKDLFTSTLAIFSYKI